MQNIISHFFEQSMLNFSSEFRIQLENAMEFIHKNQINDYNRIAFKTTNQHEAVLCFLLVEKKNLSPLFLESNFPETLEKEILKELDINTIVHGYKNLQPPLFNKENNEKFKIELPKYIIFQLSSASTGKPKIIVRTKANIQYEVNRYIRQLGIQQTDVLMSSAPLYHSYAFGSCLSAAYYAGASIVLPKKILPRNIIDDCNKHQVSILHGTPYFYKQMLSYKNEKQLPKSLKYCIASGSKMIEGLQDEFEQAFSIPLLQQYGSTETGSLAVSNPGDDGRIVGKPLEGVKFIIETDNEEKDWVYISSPETIGCYIINNELKKIDGIRFKIGDLGKITNDGKLYISGRGDNLISIAGKKISIPNLEKTILENPKIKSVKIRLHENQKSLLCEYYSEQNISEEEIIAYCRDKLLDYEIPRFFKKLKDPIYKSWKKNDNE